MTLQLYPQKHNHAVNLSEEDSPISVPLTWVQLYQWWFDFIAAKWL